MTLQLKTKRLPDAVFKSEHCLIVLFVDVPSIEIQPSTLELHADMTRLVCECKLHLGESFLPLIMVRFNPDKCTTSDKSTKQFHRSKKARYDHLLARLNQLCQDQLSFFSSSVLSSEADNAAAILLWVFFDNYVHNTPPFKSIDDSLTAYGGAAGFAAAKASLAAAAASVTVDSSSSSSSSAVSATQSYVSLIPPTLSAVTFLNQQQQPQSTTHATVPYDDDCSFAAFRVL
jgi:hypothetical protein